MLSKLASCISGEEDEWVKRYAETVGAESRLASPNYITIAGMQYHMVSP